LQLAQYPRANPSPLKLRFDNQALNFQAVSVVPNEAHSDAGGADLLNFGRALYATSVMPARREIPSASVAKCAHVGSCSEQGYQGFHVAYKPRYEGFPDVLARHYPDGYYSNYRYYRSYKKYYGAQS